MTTSSQLNAAMAVTVAIAEAIREAKEIPSGHLYAVLMNKVDLEGYQRIIQTLKNAGLVEDKGHLLKWVGPSLV